jgi:hypothetical protein
VATVFADSPIHVVDELSKPQTWNNASMKQAFSILTPRMVNNPGLKSEFGLIHATSNML